MNLNRVLRSGCQAAKIVETTFVSSRFSDKQKETTPFPIIPNRNHKKPRERAKREGQQILK